MSFDTTIKPILKSKRQDYLNWDEYFMANAVLSSHCSNDLLTQMDAIIVNEDNRIVAIGYNVILNKKCGNLKNTRLYTTIFPCKEYARLIVQSGISKILYMSDKYANNPMYRDARLILSEAQIECKRYIPTRKKIIIDLKNILGNDFKLAQDVAAEKYILGKLEADTKVDVSVSKISTASDDADVSGDADSIGGHESSFSSFEIIEMIKSSSKDYLHYDDYFMDTAILSSQRSKDPLTQVGAVIVNEDNYIVAIGYNGFPKFCNDDEFPWYKASDVQELVENFDPIHDKKMFVVHAEANAILNMNCDNLKNTRLYTTLFPCNECAKLIIQSGISKIVYMSDKYADKPKYRASRLMFSMAKIECLQYMPSQKNIIIDFEQLLEDDDLKLTQKMKNIKL